jgi:hypothetical protein
MNWWPVGNELLARLIHGGANRWRRCPSITGGGRRGGRLLIRRGWKNREGTYRIWGGAWRRSPEAGKQNWVGAGWNFHTAKGLRGLEGTLGSAAQPLFLRVGAPRFPTPSPFKIYRSSEYTTPVRAFFFLPKSHANGYFTVPADIRNLLELLSYIMNLNLSGIFVSTGYGIGKKKYSYQIYKL